jgi:hypothetical protein
MISWIGPTLKLNGTLLFQDCNLFTYMQRHIGKMGRELGVGLKGDHAKLGGSKQKKNLVSRSIE